MAGKVAISQWLLAIIVPVLVTGIVILALADGFIGPLTFNSALEHELGKESLEYNFTSKRNWTDTELLHGAVNAVAVPRTGEKRIAFLFIVRGNIPHEPVWRRFFQNHEKIYSLYVHAAPGHVFPNGSLFAEREIPSQECPRFSRGLSDALRRLYAHALIDPRYNNAWFINVCESSIPIRSFSFTYEYLMRSPVSFVESFFPVQRHHMVQAPQEFNMTALRKGELWMALRRDHAAIVVHDTEIYAAFNAHCKINHQASMFCTWDEQYVQTLLALRDAAGIANRTVMYVDWTGIHGGSPKLLQPSVDVINNLQLRTRDTDGERHDTAFDNTTYTCEWNGVSPWPCFLFARKFPGDSTQSIMDMPAEDLGY